MNQPPQKQFYHLDELPDADKNPEFWNDIQTPSFRNSVNFLIINEIRKYDPETLSPQAAQAQLCKLKAWQELLDMPEGLVKSKEKPEPYTDQLPT